MKVLAKSIHDVDAQVARVVPAWGRATESYARSGR